ncbi:unnamed protein product, partial [Arabidopsis halleri]
ILFFFLTFSDIIYFHSILYLIAWYYLISLQKNLGYIITCHIFFDNLYVLDLSPYISKSRDHLFNKLSFL